MAVELIQASSELSIDSEYLRRDRRKNLLRWDLTVKPTADTISYTFRLQYDRKVAIGNFQPAKR